MAMGKKRKRNRQASIWVATSDLPRSAGHPFYERLNRVLDDAGVEAFVEAQCAPFDADDIGRPSLAPGRYFRLLLLGYFEGLDSERAIAWRAADSLSIRQFLDLALHEAPPAAPAVAHAAADRLGLLTVFRCTQRVLRRFKLTAIEPETASTGVLGDWYANLSTDWHGLARPPHGVVVQLASHQLATACRPMLGYDS